MPIPIKHAPKPQPTPRAAEHPEHDEHKAPAPLPARRPLTFDRASAGMNEKRTGAAGTGRSDWQSGRSTSRRSVEDESMNADGLFFSQLLVPSVSEEPDQQSFAGSNLDFSGTTEPVPAQLIDEVAQRLPDQPAGPLNFTLLMPNLGQVRVNAEKSEARWNIQLGFNRRDVLKRLQGRTGACRDALALAMGHDVDLHLHEDLAA